MNSFLLQAVKEVSCLFFCSGIDDTCILKIDHKLIVVLILCKLSVLLNYIRLPYVKSIVSWKNFCEREVFKFLQKNFLLISNKECASLMCIYIKKNPTEPCWSFSDTYQFTFYNKWEIKFEYLNCKNEMSAISSRVNHFTTFMISL